MYAWKDPWFKVTYNFKLLTDNLFLRHSMKVYHLIDQDTRRWKDGLLWSSFLPRDPEEIRKIPISPLLTEDVLIWHYEKSAKFTIRLAYHMGMDFMARVALVYEPGLA